MPNHLMLLVLVGGLTLRAIVSRQPHSGLAHPPMYGDYEAQRHWQEVTVNLPLSSWYFNTTDNDLNYWGLDYPPLTAYHSWLIGKVAEMLNSSYVALGTSRGIEDDGHRFFMRSTVLISDLFIYAMSVLAFGLTVHSGDETRSMKSSLLMLAYPGLILIDHGHFQYNGISLGLMLFAVTALFSGRDCLGSALFVAALNYKQMELYHALPFFFYLLGKSFFLESTWKSTVLKLFSIGSTVIATFILIWFPFMDSIEHFLQVVHRVFPLARGVFEDKVANVWCAVNVIVKIKEIYDVKTLAMGCLIATGLSSLPSNILLFLQPSKTNMLLALINTSIAFFLFSFQVHEKSILLVAIPVLMLLGGPTDCHTRYTPLFCIWFLMVSTTSMFPLLQKDLLSLATLALCAFFLILSHFLELFEPVRQPKQMIKTQKGGRPSPKPLEKNQVSTWIDWIVWTAFNFSLVGFLVLCAASNYVQPPNKYPHIWHLLISLFSLGHFLFFAFYFNMVQFQHFNSVRKTEKLMIQSKKKN